MVGSPFGPGALEVLAYDGGRDAVAAQHLGGALGREDLEAEVGEHLDREDHRAACRGWPSRRTPCPPVGSEPNAAAWALANARAEVGVEAHHLAGRLHLRAEHGVDVAAVGRAEPVERHHRLLDRDRRVGRQVAAVAGRRQQALGAQLLRSSRPSITRAAALASGVAVALETNGTVRLARGLASRT